jgi:hypothetical protein
MSDEDKYVETQLGNGGTIIEFVNPPPAPTHKTKGLEKTEYRSILTATEQIKNDKARANIEGDLTWLSGSVGADDDAAAIGFAGLTYRDLLRTTFSAYNDATVLDMDNAQVQLGLEIQSLLGLLDSPDRKDVIILGKQL